MRNDLIAVLDIGSSKIYCLIAAFDQDARLKIVGIGQHVSRGIRYGNVVSIEALEHSVRAAVDQAEEMADEQIKGVIINISGGNPTSLNQTIEFGMNGHAVSPTDLSRIIQHARGLHQTSERTLIHALPVDYIIDGNDGIPNPIGMYGDRLGVAIHLIGANASAVRNLETVVSRCHLNIEAKVASAYASGLACLLDDEKELGVTCIDLGAGTTSLSCFLNGQLIHSEMIPIGGSHVTSDIARGLSTPIHHAEHIKIVYGSALSSPGDDKQMIKIIRVGEPENDAHDTISRITLGRIIQPRLEETFEIIKTRLAQSDFDKLAERRIVLTGGASQMQDIRELATKILDKNVRLGYAITLEDLPETVSDPSFSTCIGLIRYALLHKLATSRAGRRLYQAEHGHLSRIGQWLKRNF